jgi:quercetin dioxygenase-like cupin family protein
MNEVEKPWGAELWFAQTDKYVGKLLFVNKGCRLSLQYHKKKDETLLVLGGAAKFTINGEVKRVTRLDGGIRIEPNTNHRIEALTDLTLVEVSTPEVDDVVRLEDDYGR